MNEKQADFISLFEGLGEKSETDNAINGFLSLIPRLPKGTYIRQFEIFHKEELADIIKNAVDNNRAFYPIYTSLPNFIGFYFNQNKSFQSEKGFLGILPGSSPNISKIISVSQLEFWNVIVRRLVKKLYPYAMPIFFRQGEIEQALHNFESGLGYKFRIRIADVTAKEERSINSNIKIRSYDTQRWWTDLPISDVFSQAKERGQWFSGIKFVIQRRIADTDRFFSSGSGRIYKFGEISYDSFYPEINSLMLSYLEKEAYKRISTLDGRSIRDSNYQPVRPLELSFEYDIFSELEEVRRFGRVVSEYPNATKVIYHSNPYYHANVADFLDGSSFEVWVLSTKKVVLLPQAKSTAQAFERFIGHISSNFSEGVVNEYHG